VDDDYAPGHYLVRLRNGEKLDLDIHNRYLAQAGRLTGDLYTKPELQKSFPAVFKNPELPIILEIGCYMGDTVVEIAQRNRDLNVLGVDIKYKRVVKSCYKIQRAKLSNAKIAIGDARELIALLPDSSLYGIIAFFPDPWQKKKHKKNRFLDDGFFESASTKLTDRGFIWIKTDSRAYYEEIKGTLHKYNLTAVESLPRPLTGENHLTFFEQLFIKAEEPIYQLFIGKLNNSRPADKS
jgi:tRNA (guanine-N7-)-methyltransferase